MADAMSWTQKYFKVTTTIDIATLTGAICVALGSSYGGLFANDDIHAKNLINAGNEYFEQHWRMPICPKVAKTMIGTLSDLINHGKTLGGGAIQSATFLENFVQKGLKWAYLNIASMMVAETRDGMYDFGSRGFGCATMIHFVKHMANN